MPTKKVRPDVPKFIYWAPRVGAILFLIFLAMFSLDIFEGGYGFWGTVVGLFMHNIPVMILTIVLAISWRLEYIGGVVFILAGLLYTAVVWKTAIMHPLDRVVYSGILLIACPALAIGILFWINWFRKSKTKIND